MKLAFTLSLALALSQPLLAAPIEVPPGATAPPAAAPPDKAPDNTPPAPPPNQDQDNPPPTTPTAEAIPNDTSVHDASINLQDLISVLNINLWKWQFRLPSTTSHVFFIREEWHKGDKEPNLLKEWDFYLNPTLPPLATDLHTVVIRWPSRENPSMILVFDGNGSGLITPQDEPYYGRSYGIRPNYSNHPGGAVIELNEPFTLIQTTYKSNNAYGPEDYKPGKEIINDRTVFLKMVAADDSVDSVRWNGGKIVLEK